MSPAAHQGNSPSLITSDDASFCVVTDGQWGASQLGRSAILRPGDGLLMSCGEVGSVTFPDECRYVIFTVPRSCIEPLVHDIDALFARRTPAANPALQMLMRYIQLVRDDSVMTTPELHTAFTNHVCDLLALTLGPTRDAAEMTTRRGLRAARLSAIKEDIRRNLGRPNLSVHAIAARHRVSSRYVQMLFEESGSTFARFLLEQRLNAVHDALATRPDMPISSIVYDHGFNDISNFNRAFRHRFGCTPSDVRKASFCARSGAATRGVRLM
jgi:AraC-like DNA-binding protein